MCENTCMLKQIVFTMSALTSHIHCFILALTTFTFFTRICSFIYICFNCVPVFYLYISFICICFNCIRIFYLYAVLSLFYLDTCFYLPVWTVLFVFTKVKFIKDVLSYIWCVLSTYVFYLYLFYLHTCFISIYYKFYLHAVHFIQLCCISAWSCFFLNYLFIHLFILKM